MPVSLKLLLYLAIIFYFLWIYRLLRDKKLNLRYSLMWIFSALVLLLIVIFIDDFEKILHFIGIAEGMNGLFAIAIFMILLMLMVLTSVVSQMNNKYKILVQKYALMEKRIRELEEENNEDDSTMFT